MTTYPTAAEIRASYQSFFESKGHKIVPSASLMPTSPNLLFTNAGMNQFVPYFLGERQANETRVADTQKCIRAGGKHNDLDDVGYDTYHQTFFEMLGNWSFGDYFKQEAITWAWELLTKVWGFPKERLYATVYQPDEGDPAAFDDEAYQIWKKLFEAEGMDPEVHLRYGDKKDNFWMMGDTGPCGPCSEVHIDLTPEGDSGGALVNCDSPYCIEIWNLVFIQFNANEDGSFVPLAAQHVDTGMGFERVAGIIATTRGFTDFALPPSNYNSDLFSPIFAEISKLCGQCYAATLPADPKKPTPEEMQDVVFRVIADHIRTLCCAIADGILPGNEGRNYVLRRILRRAVMYGRRLELPPGFFTQLAEPVIASLGPVFPELVEQREVIIKVLGNEEGSFDRTLDRGMSRLERIFATQPREISGKDAFELYDTYGFPLDLTEILAGEVGLRVDTDGFHHAMEAQRTLARAAQQKTVIRLAEDGEGEATRFVGFDMSQLLDFETEVVAVLQEGEQTLLLTTATPFYAEMGGQVGDRGFVRMEGREIAITQTSRDGQARHLHHLAETVEAEPGTPLQLSVDVDRRQAIQRHHTATHILHWALHETLGSHVKQAGSWVGPERLRFDFNHFEQVDADTLSKVERLCNQRLLADDEVNWFEVPFDEKPEDVVAFFGDKYGDVVRVVDIGGWSRELCGGAHVQRAGEIGPLRILVETSIASGVRRIEAVCGITACDATLKEHHLLREAAGALSATPEELPERVSNLLQQNKLLEKQLKQLAAEAARGQVGGLLEKVQEVEGVALIAENLGEMDMDGVRTVMDTLRDKLDSGLILLASSTGGKAVFMVTASEDLVARGVHAGKLVGAVAKLAGGGGGGQPKRAQAGGKDVSKLPEAVAATPDILRGMLG